MTYKDDVEYHMKIDGCNVTFVLDGWEGNEERIKERFAKALVEAATQKLRKEAAA